jgi:hypothetical protein
MKLNEYPDVQNCELQTQRDHNHNFLKDLSLCELNLSYIWPNSEEWSIVSSIKIIREKYEQLKGNISWNQQIVQNINNV